MQHAGGIFDTINDNYIPKSERDYFDRTRDFIYLDDIHKTYVDQQFILDGRNIPIHILSHIVQVGGDCDTIMNALIVLRQYKESPTTPLTTFDARLCVYIYKCIFTEDYFEPASYTTVDNYGVRIAQSIKEPELAQKLIKIIQSDIDLSIIVSWVHIVYLTASILFYVQINRFRTLLVSQLVCFLSMCKNDKYCMWHIIASLFIFDAVELHNMLFDDLLRKCNIDYLVYTSIIDQYVTIMCNKTVFIDDVKNLFDTMSGRKNCHDTIVLINACSTGNLDMVKNILLPQNIYSDSLHVTPLHASCINGHINIVNYLLNAQPSNAYLNGVTLNNETPIDYAVIGNHKQIINLLLARGGKVSDNTYDRYRYGMYIPDAIIDCVKDESIAHIEKIVKDCPIINYADTYRNTPIHMASLYGNFEGVKYLLDKGRMGRMGIDINIKNKSQDLPISMAIMGGHRDIVGLLLVSKTTLYYLSSYIKLYCRQHMFPSFY